MMASWRRRSSARPGDRPFWTDSEGQSRILVRNAVWEYAAIAVTVGLGLAMLPFNVAHLGQSAYGLWMLTTSVTTYFSIFDLGYGSAQVKFAAQYRALRDAGALNEIASTLFFLFLAVGAVAYAAAAVVAFNLDRIFNLTPDQTVTGRDILLIVSLYLALGFPFSVFGGVVNGFQRYYLNNIVAIATSVLAAAANVVILLLGYGVVELVVATTTIKLLGFIAYRRSAYHAFPLLQIRWRHVRKERLREVTAFSAFLLIIDIAAKINLSADTMVIGAFMSTAAIAVWTVGKRLIDVTRMLSRVLTHLLFPSIVDSATRDRIDRLRFVLVQGTRLSLATVIPLASVTAVLAAPVVDAWVGPRFAGSVPVIWVLAAVVSIRMGTSTGTSILKGAGRHRFLAWWSAALALSNLLLSVLLVRTHGLLGVALGTLIPVGVVSLFVLFPASCRRVQLPVSRAVREAVWPALWPVLPAAGAVFATRDLAGANLLLLFATAVAGGLLYVLVFLWLAIGVSDRRWYLEKVRALVRRPPLVVAT